MSNQIQVGMRKDFQSKDLWEMHRLRTRVFKDRMGWEVPILSGMEIDGYDAIDPYSMVIRGAENVVCGCWRMLPTEGPYMLKDTFPELLHGVEPRRRRMSGNSVASPSKPRGLKGLALPAWHLMPCGRSCASATRWALPIT